MFCSLLARCTIPCACHAKRHLNVQKWSEHVVFLTAALASLLVDLPGAQIIGKNTVFRDFPTFSRAWIFFLLRLSRFWYSFFFLLSFFFSSLLFSALLCSARLVSSLLFSSLLFSSLLFSSLLFSSLTLPISAFHLSIWSEVWLLNFLRKLFKSFGLQVSS